MGGFCLSVELYQKGSACSLRSRLVSNAIRISQVELVICININFELSTIEFRLVFYMNLAHPLSMMQTVSEMTTLDPEPTDVSSVSGKLPADQTCRRASWPVQGVFPRYHPHDGPKDNRMPADFCN